MEHLQHFGLSQDPFQNEPDLRFYFDGNAHRDAQRRVERGLRQAKGLTVLVGEPGTGKSLLARRLLEGLEEELFEASLMVAVKGNPGSSSFLRRFAGQLDIEEPAGDPATLMGQIYEALAVVREDGRHAVLIVDEADGLSSESFCELASLLNLEYEERRLVSVLLVGSLELDAALARESGLLQRVDVRVRLAPLDLDDSSRYLAHRVRVAGGGTALLPGEAVEALYKFSRGRPRLLNTLADNGLFEAFLGSRPAVTAVDVERAASDLGIGEDPGTTWTELPGTPPPPTAAGDPGDSLVGCDPGASLAGADLGGPDLAGADPGLSATGLGSSDAVVGAGAGDSGWGAASAPGDSAAGLSGFGGDPGSSGLDAGPGASGLQGGAGDRGLGTAPDDSGFGSPEDAAALSGELGEAPDLETGSAVFGELTDPGTGPALDPAEATSATVLDLGLEEGADDALEALPLVEETDPHARRREPSPEGPATDGEIDDLFVELLDD